MSVFGGDSWGREAQLRKRRVDDLVAEGLQESAYKKLSNGSYACRVCPHNPILDSSLMFSMHCKGSRHRASMSKLKERELIRENEMKKRIALSESSIGGAHVPTSSTLQAIAKSKPLLVQTRKVTYEILRNKKPERSNAIKNSARKVADIQSKNKLPNPQESGSFPASEATAGSMLLTGQQLDYRERQERQLKLTAAGWKRDGHGKWYKDENVEFDSDEEDPNACLT